MRNVAHHVFLLSVRGGIYMCLYVMMRATSSRINILDSMLNLAMDAAFLCRSLVDC